MVTRLGAATHSRPVTAVILASKLHVGLAAGLMASTAWANQPPQISDITVSPTPASGGMTVRVTAWANDPEGQPLTFHWSTLEGTLAGDEDQDPRVEWTLPAGEGNFMLSLEVRDPQGGSTSAERLVPVGPIRSYRTISGDMRQPTRAAVDDQGDLWLTDAAAAQVLHFSSAGKWLGGFATAPRPLGIAVQPDSTLLVGEDSLDRVARYTPDGTLIGVLGTGPGEFAMPNAIAVDSVSGRIHVVDSKRDHVRVFSSGGSPEFTIGGPSVFDFPVDIAINPTVGEIYVGDQGSSRIIVLDLSGTQLRTIGTAVLPRGQLARIQGVALDTEGRLLVLDSFQSNVLLLEPTGEHIATFGHLGDWTGAMRTPLGLGALPGRQIFVTSGGTGEVEVFVPLGWFPPWAGHALVIR